MSFRTKYRLRATGEIVSDHGFRVIHPNVSFPQVITQQIANDFYADLVELKDPPSLQRGQQADILEPAYDEATGRWTQDWAVSDITDPVQLADIQRQVEQERKNAYLNYTQQYLNEGAQVCGYDDIKSAALRAAYPGPYQEEGVAFATWMDECWFLTFELLQQSTNTLDQQQLIEQLPKCPVEAKSF